jgi:accessory gene regulator protein AgrB
MKKSQAFLLVLTVVLYQIMFVYSGVRKIQNFPSKTETLGKRVHKMTRVHMPTWMIDSGMVAVIILEVIGSLVLIVYAFAKTKKQSRPSKTFTAVAKTTTISMATFLVVVTLLYHPPNEKMIPFLSNTTCFAGFLLMWQVLFDGR